MAIGIEELSPRHLQVLSLTAKGECNKSIARILGISIKTVEKHRIDMRRKLGLGNTADMTRFAIRYHMITMEDLEKEWPY